MSVTSSGPQCQGIQSSKASSKTVSAPSLLQLWLTKQPSQHLSQRSAIVDCFVLVSAIWQPAVFPVADPLTLCLSEPPAEPGSLNVKTEPSHGLFEVSKPNCTRSTVITPGLLLRYLRIDLMFFMSVSLARPRLDEVFFILHMAGPLCRSAIFCQPAVETPDPSAIQSNS